MCNGTDTMGYAKDFYEKSHHYVSGAETGTHESMSAVRNVKGRRHAVVTVYRAIPHGLKGAKINEGDWVSSSREYAKEHGRSNLNSKYRIISKKVKAIKYAVFTKKTITYKNVPKPPNNNKSWSVGRV
jgi:hypothetical protein